MTTELLWAIFAVGSVCYLLFPVVVGAPIFAMINLTEASNSHVSNNQIDGGGRAIGVDASDFLSAVAGFSPNSSNDRITNNIISNGLPGVGIDSDTTGYSVIDG